MADGGADPSLLIPVGTVLQAKAIPTAWVGNGARTELYEFAFGIYLCVIDEHTLRERMTEHVT
jgi:hypothetical protein